MTLARILSDFSFASWQTWAVPAASVIGASVGAFVVGKLVLGRRQAPATAPRPKTDEPAPDPFVTGSTSERRSAYRRQGNPVEVILADVESKIELMHGWVVDRSLGGLCLHLDQAVTPGTILNIRPCKAPLGTLWMPIEIRSCRQDCRVFEIGCRFVRTPSWGQLLLFN